MQLMTMEIKSNNFNFKNFLIYMVRKLVKLKQMEKQNVCS